MDKQTFVAKLGELLDEFAGDDTRTDAEKSNEVDITSEAQGLLSPSSKLKKKIPVAPKLGRASVFITKKDPAGNPVTIKADAGGLEQAMADGWTVVIDDDEPKVPLGPVQKVPVQELTCELKNALSQYGPMYAWLFDHLEKVVKGVAPLKQGAAIGKGGTVPGYRGEIVIKRVHDAAVAAQEDYGFDLECQVGPKKCSGGRRQCPLREAIRFLAVQEDFPMRVVEKRKGPWGDRFVFDG